jgi:hypothetical protein
VFVAIENCFIQNLVHHHRPIADHRSVDWPIVATDSVRSNPSREDVKDEFDGIRMLCKEAGARFLKRTNNNNNNNNNKGSSSSSTFVELNEKQARKKVGHALRDMATAKQLSAMKELKQHQQRKKRAKAKLLLIEGNDEIKYLKIVLGLCSPPCARIIMMTFLRN